MFSQIMSQLLVGVCCASANMLIMSLAVFIRHLPAISNAGRRVLRFLLLYSFRVYRTLLAWLAPFFYNLTQLDLLNGWPRLAATIILSLALGGIVLWLLGWRFKLWNTILCSLHGLAVGALWDELATPGGLQLGERIQ